MATISTSWTEGTNLSTIATSLAAGISDSEDIDLANNGYIAVLIQTSVYFDTNATDGCTIEIFASADSGTTADTIPIISRKVEVQTSTTVNVSLLVENVPYIKYKLTNDDGTYSLTSIVVDYAGLEYSSV